MPPTRGGTDRLVLRKSYPTGRLSSRSRLLHGPWQPTDSFDPCCPGLSPNPSMAIESAPLPLPSSADPSSFVDFGREVKGVSSRPPSLLRSSTTHSTRLALRFVLSGHRPRFTNYIRFTPLSHQHGALLFRNVTLTPQQQHALTKDPYLSSSNLPPSFRLSFLNPRAIGMATTRPEIHSSLPQNHPSHAPGSTHRQWYSD